LAGFSRRTYCQRTKNQPTVAIFFRYGQLKEKKTIDKQMNKLKTKLC